MERSSHVTKIFFNPPETGANISDRSN